MLVPEPFDFRLRLSDKDALAFPEGCILLQQLLESDLTFKALRFGDPRDGYVGGFRADEALLQNLEREPFFKLHSRSTEDRPNRPGRTPLLTDNFAEIVLRHSQLQNRRLLALNRTNCHLIGIVH